MANTDAYSPPTGTMPGYDAFAITPSATPLTRVARALFIGVAGNVTVKTIMGTSVTFIGVQAGTILPIQVNVVNTTANGTTAGSILGIT